MQLHVKTRKKKKQKKKRQTYRNVSVSRSVKTCQSGRANELCRRTAPGAVTVVRNQPDIFTVSFR